jgi:hypothetical protein
VAEIGIAFGLVFFHSDADTDSGPEHAIFETDFGFVGNGIVLSGPPS